MVNNQEVLFYIFSIYEVDGMGYVCEHCGNNLKYYDKVSRMVRTKNRIVSTIDVKRYKCSSCNCIHRKLPSNLLPYKQYSTEIIFGVVKNLITCESVDYEDYPCEMTMLRWRKEFGISDL